MKIYGEYEMWNDKNWKQSFKDLKNDGYDYTRIEKESWLTLDNWQPAVLCRVYAKKIIRETEKALQFSIVTQYGKEYKMWFPKSALISY